MVQKIDVDCKTTNGFYDPHGEGLGPSCRIPVTIIQEHPHASSRFNVEVLLSAQVVELKLDFQIMLNLPIKDQIWSFKNRELNDTDTIQTIGIQKHDIIVCQTTYQQ